MLQIASNWSFTSGYLTFTYRSVCEYFYKLKKSTEEIEDNVACIWALLKTQSIRLFGLLVKCR